MSVHTIRLAGPWELHTDSSGPVRVTLPYEFSGREDSGCLLRRFHRPSGLTDESCVFIVLSLSGRPGQVLLNDEELTPAAPAADSTKYACDVTSLLQSFNTIRVQLAESDRTSITLQAAAMEIHEA